ncbi:MAG: hypothetical protein QOK07_3088, partial [Gemmatimonadaceae bacterium]|nr:hypothetical protein [Gemmatimonadaceae bacterium]
MLPGRLFLGADQTPGRVIDRAPEKETDRKPPFSFPLKLG